MISNCHNCNQNVIGAERGRYVVQGDPFPELLIILFECPDCHQPILTRQKVEISMIDREVQLDWKKPDQLYPSDKFIVNSAIPEPLSTALADAIKTYQAGVHTAAAIMCRRSLDGFCAENGATKRSLAANLEELRDNGIITDQLFEWATALRLSGNEAAHDVTVTFSAEDARDLLDFTVAILDFTYSYRVKLEAFRARRGGDGTS